MNNIEIKYNRTQFIDITKDVKIRMGNPKYPYEFFQCVYYDTNIGIICWHEENEQYCYYPVEDLALPTNVIWDIFEKICELMKTRRLN
ncbi:MAG: hypothetical protein IIT65_04730 [Lachnospiraceae bacterium]|nr:hypothetical protein [Lachnospiraceae bacterium]